MVFKKAKKTNITIAKNKSEKEIIRFANMELSAIYTEFSSSPTGLSLDQIKKSTEKYGANIITTDTKNNTFHRLIKAITGPFNMVLFVIAAITFFTDVINSSKPDYLTVGIIFLLVTISSTVSFIQEERGNSAAEKLSKMIISKSNILRDGTFDAIPIDKIVPGDIVKLSAGDMIPADIRFLSTKDTFVAQAALTGESNPVEKFADMNGDSQDAVTDLPNIGFMGSNIISGSASGVVLATGNNTYMGSMAETLSGDRAKNSFERGVYSVSRLLIQLMLVMVPIVMVINGISKGDWASAILFSISIAVGLTPELLPVIMTSTLAKGAVAMSKREVIVKSLGAIQTLGEMDVLCTDKTGTLTEDKIILEKYLNLLGEDDTRILRHAFLNSYFQTGLKDLLDIAIINRANEYKMDDILCEYECIDEIPFDFSRRRMSVVLKDVDGKRQLITKGAVEEIMSICSFAELDGEVIDLDSEQRKNSMEVYEKYNNDGLRMIAVAQKNEVPAEGEFDVTDESNMVLIGFIGFLDPPKESAKAAIEALDAHGVRTVVLTGDSEGVAKKVCSKVGIDTKGYLTGKDVESMGESELKSAVEKCNLFAKLSPLQKEKVVETLQLNGHTVGYLGDGINDAPPMHMSDVGISVNSAVDIAKETADIILLQNDLMVLEEGVVEGRRTFGNIIKYIKTTAGGNFGNMISVIIASIFLPFLPMIPVQILAQNLLCDFAQMGIPFDNVDKEYLQKPRKWDTNSIKTFMAYMGPLSSVFDIICFSVLWWIIGADKPELAPMFQCGWFVFGTISQVIIVYMIRTAKIPFVQSLPAKSLFVSTVAVMVVTMIIGFTDLALALDMMPLPFSFILWLILISAGYCILTQILKVFYIKKYKEWL